MKKTVLSLLLFTLLFVLSACGSLSLNTDQGETRTITHAMGETEVPVNPERIVILTNEGTEALLAHGITPVGAVQSWNGSPWYPHITEQMDDVTVVGFETDVNLEAIISLNPDLIIGNKMRQEEIYDDLSLIAPTVFSETLLGEWQNNFTFYSQVLGLETEGQTMLNDFDTKLDTVKSFAQNNNLLDTEIAIVRFMAGHTRLYLTESFSGVILDAVGFNRTTVEDPSGQNFAVQITKEQLIDAGQSSDIIIYFTYESGDQDATNRENEWTNDPVFNSLPAAVAENTYKVNDAIWNTSGGILAANKTVEDLQAILESYIEQ